MAAGVAVVMSVGASSAMANRNHDNDDDRDKRRNRECVVTDRSHNETGKQSGLVNVGTINLGNLAGNLLCDGDILNGLTAAVLGKAIGGGDDHSDGRDRGDDCVATDGSKNQTGGQGGLVNVGTINAGNAAANALCQADILNDATAAVLGTAIGGDGDSHGPRDHRGGGLLGGLIGDDGLLGGLGILF